MAAATVQVPVLMSKAQKTRLARKAKASKLTMGELLRQDSERFDPQENLALLAHLAHLAHHVTLSTNKTIREIDHTLSLVAASERRIERLMRTTRKTSSHGAH